MKSMVVRLMIAAIGVTHLVGREKMSRSANRRTFLKTTAVAWICLMLSVLTTEARADPYVLVEAEGFCNLGGWVLDQQFMDQMGSPFLLAHGLGEPVKDATTSVTFPKPGTYRVWVRARDWVGTWKNPKLPKPQQAEDSPGIFQVLVNGRPLSPTFGEQGAEWHWQDGGSVRIDDVKATVALHDLTGFEGRCDAILFCADAAFVPPAGGDELATFRHTLLGLPDQPENGGEFDLVVVGGGMAGSCAAVSAARMGLCVALIQDRPVLGGNNSVEVNVFLDGGICRQPYPKIGNLVKELDIGISEGKVPLPEMEAKRLAVLKAEDNITLFLNHRANGVEMEDRQIRSVIAQNIRIAKRLRLMGRWFADCTGDACIGFLAKADFEMTVPGHMGQTNLWIVEDVGRPSPFPRCPWALGLKGAGGPLGNWSWESGFAHDPIVKGEYIRDWNFRAMYGAWDAIKNVRREKPNHAIVWAAYVSGKRESRRLLGDVYLTGQDMGENRPFPDGCVPCTFWIDVHGPAKLDEAFKGEEFRSTFVPPSGSKKPPVYWLPYRCLYSRSVPNLFMAGRDISVDRAALGSARVMRTCGMMGEVVGLAASLCKKHDTTPRGVYEKHLEDLKDLLRQGVPSPHPAK